MIRMRGWAPLDRGDPAAHGRFVIGLGGMLILLTNAGCSKNDSVADTSQSVPSTTLPASATKPDPVPTSIAGIGHYAENAYDMGKASDWTGARAATDSVRAAVAALPNTGAASSEDASALIADVALATDSLARAVGLRDARETMLSANRLTELAARLSDPYGPRVPANVTLLDFYGRELELWAAAPNGTRDTRLRETASAIRRTWEEVEPQVIARGGVTEAARFDSLVTQVAAAENRAEYAQLATPLLDQVDFLENVFTR